MASLLKHGTVMFASIVIANLFAYALQIYFGRILGPAEYGVFGSLMALFLILSIPVSTISNIFTKFVSKFKAEKNYAKISALILNSFKKLFFYGVLGFILITILSPLIADYLKISSRIPIICVGLVLIFSVLLPIARGSLQGLQKFNSLAFNNIFEAVIRLILGIILVNFGVSGAILSYGLAYFLAFLVGLISLKFLFNKKENFNVKEIYIYAYPVLIAITCLAVLINLPTILVKHYFNALDSGYWNAALTISRAILYAGAGFSTVMFAKVAENHAKNENTKKILYGSLIYTSMIGFFAVALFLIFPEFIIKLLFSSGYEGSYALLRLLGFVTFTYTIGLIFVNYELAIGKTDISIWLVVLSILEIILMLVFNSSILNFIYIMLIINITLIIIGFIRTSNS